jgi:hypothetical protein
VRYEIEYHAKFLSNNDDEFQDYPTREKSKDDPNMEDGIVLELCPSPVEGLAK